MLTLHSLRYSPQDKSNRLFRGFSAEGIRLKLQVRRVLSIAFVISILSGFLSVAKAETSVALWQGDKKSAVSITFDEIDDSDDVLGSQYDNAFPLLQQHGLKATFFIFSNNPNENEIVTL
ncbi:MAG: polysaccharide deacetylase family protein, partial [Planctomycetota bacterium]